MENLINIDQLEKILLVNWTTFINKTTLLRQVLINVRDTDFPINSSHNIPPAKTQITITRFRPENNHIFEIWIEFTVPKNDGVAVGTFIYNLKFPDFLELKSSFGTIFCGI